MQNDTAVRQIRQTIRSARTDNCDALVSKPCHHFTPTSANCCLAAVSAPAAASDDDRRLLLFSVRNFIFPDNAEERVRSTLLAHRFKVVDGF